MVRKDLKMTQMGWKLLWDGPGGKKGQNHHSLSDFEASEQAKTSPKKAKTGVFWSF